jgi:hypothetical protein
MPSVEACFPRVSEGSARIHGAAGSEWFGSLQWGVITADGTWVVADGRRTALHLIRPGGSHRLVGRRGDGPGEFRALSRLWVTPGDTISVFDVGSGRVTSFNSNGEILDSRLFPFQEFPRGIMGEVSSGGVLLQRTVTRHGVPGRGLFRDSLELVVARDGQEQLVLGPLPGSDRYLEGFPVFPVPFGLRVTYRLVGGRHLLVAPGTGPELTLVDLEEETTHSVPVPLAPRRVDQAMLRALEANLDQGASRWDAGLVQEMTARGQLPQETPTYVHAHLDREGWVWVQEYPAPGEPAAYLILDRDGEVHQRLVLPGSVPPHGSPVLAADASTALFRAEDEAGTPLLLVMDRECEAG